MTEASTLKDANTTNDDLLTLQPPHNMDIERALLASLMSIDDSFEKIDGIVKAEDFYGERHRQIFNAINHLSRVNQPYDTLMVHDFLSQQNLLAMAGGEEYLMQINQSPATLFNLIPYAERVREFSVYRQLIKSANTMLNLAYHPKKQTVSEILDVVEADIFRINEDYSRGTGKQGVRRVEDILQSVTDQLVEIKSRQGGLIGLRTPFEELNNKNPRLTAGRSHYFGGTSVHGEDHLCHESRPRSTGARATRGHVLHGDACRIHSHADDVGV